jgi:hypothetical protein
MFFFIDLTKKKKTKPSSNQTPPNNALQNSFAKIFLIKNILK